MLNAKQIKNKFDQYVIPCYAKMPQAFNKAKGLDLWNDVGHRYVDFFSGWAVSGVGHCHPRVVKAIQKQASEFIHLPNNYYHQNQGLLAEKIIKSAFPGKVFFCNSGAEAIEGAIKLIRAFDQKKTGILTMKKSFHGRTIGAMSATGQKRFHKAMKPLLNGFKQIPFNDIEAFKKALKPSTGAVILELIQGEGGVNIADVNYVHQLRKICTQKKVLLVVDEVQTGMGRTGKLFAFEHYGITPDIILLAKSLGGGFPIGAIVAGKKLQDVLQPGMHASTFGGSPLACAAGLAVFETIESEKLLQKVGILAPKLIAALENLSKKYSVIKSVRGKGYMLAIELNVPAQPIFDTCFKKRMLINVTQGNVIRLSPPLTLKASDVKAAIKILDEAFESMSKNTNKDRS